MTSNKTKSDVDIDEIHRLIGKAMSRWSDIELDLYRVFAITIGAHQTDALSAAFYSSPMASTKISMVDSALRMRFKSNDPGDKKIIKKWDESYKLIDKAKVCRNHLAHFHIVVSVNTKTRKRNVRLRPHWTNMKIGLNSKKPQNRIELSAKDVSNYLDVILKAQNKLIIFLNNHLCPGEVIFPEDS